MTHPVVVGGLGGSGTRAVVEVLQRAGVDIGRHLNPALDHPVFGFLFRRPEWFRRQLGVRDGAGIADLLDDFVAFRRDGRRSRLLGRAYAAAARAAVRPARTDRSLRTLA